MEHNVSEAIKCVKTARTWKSRTFCVLCLVNTARCLLATHDGVDPVDATSQLL
jgi:hypothetical protein